MEDSCIVLALDPGVTTGFAWAKITDGKVEAIGGGQAELTETGLYGLLSSISPAAVVIESFEFRQRARDGLELYSRNLLGVCKLWTDLRDVPYFEQSASKGKSFFTDEKLRALGAYTSGQPHKRDATRHLFEWLTFRQGSKLLEEPFYKGKNA